MRPIETKHTCNHFTVVLMLPIYSINTGSIRFILPQLEYQIICHLFFIKDCSKPAMSTFYNPRKLISYRILSKNTLSITCLILYIRVAIIVWLSFEEVTCSGTRIKKNNLIVLSSSKLPVYQLN